MRIGIIGPIWQQIPPKKYGGTEQIVYNLTNALVEKGHTVTLFAPATTQTKAHLIPTISEPLREKDVAWTELSYHLYHLTQAFDQANEFDLLHLHLNKNQDYMALPLASLSHTPVITTLHFSTPTPTFKKDRYEVLMKYKDLPYTSISYAQRGTTPLNFIANVYNSLELKEYPFIAQPKDYFLWLGKIKPEKGTKEAILAAKKAGVKLILAGAVDTGVKEYLDYFEYEVKPLIDGKHSQFIGEVGLPEKATLLGEAKALLNPIQWEEPFGLVMIESLATGTPVIANNRGSAAELIDNNKTGFLVTTIDEMAEKIHQVESLDRDACRRAVEEKFTTQRMAEGYEMAYQATIEHWPTYQLGEKERKKRMERNMVKI